ncbi:hypothetical protein K5I29_02380 [Flavobacterium agricola]|uniref:Uncharacterized protein n=1 Tax=Flavobacterium agricola TaxID=2870839 RepID=A0ABY6M3J3_9FLAO|nr:hypothetical protein [Flavobacterium agricola]UYW01791.1 hypothetical protein K5I29_02380 [Flavobacterium agricola]
MIPNITETQNSNKTEVLIHIQKYEKEILEFVLGPVLYVELLENLETDDEGYYKLKDTAEDKWKWLVNGQIYGSCNKLRWEGLVFEVAKVNKQPLLETVMAPYIFYQWLLKERSVSTGVGEIKGEPQGGVSVTSKHKRTDAWNTFVGHAYSLNRFMQFYCDLFPNFKCVELNPQNYYDL